MNQLCQHFPRVTIKRNLANHQHLQEKLKKKALKCTVCSRNMDHPWLCISVIHFFKRKCQAPLCEDNRLMHLEEHARAKGANDHCIFINVYYTEMICVTCQCEILDFEQYGKTGNEEYFKHWVNPQRVRLEYHHLLKGIEIPKPHVDIDHCGILNMGNSGFINCVLQVVLNIKLISKIFKKVNAAYEKQKQEARSQKKKFQYYVNGRFLRYLCHISECMRLRSPKIINPIDLVRTLSQIHKCFSGYSQKDAFEFFKFFVNFVHEEFKFTNNVKYEQEASPWVNTQPIDHEWQIMTGGNLHQYKDYSVVQSAFKGKLLSNSTCQKCRNSTVTVEDYLGLSLEIPVKNESNNLIEKMANKLGQLYYYNHHISLVKQAKITLKDCFENFFSVDQLVPNQICGSCKCVTSQDRKYAFKQLPNYFCVHLQRLSDNRVKNTTHIEFPIEIDFGQILRVKNEQGIIQSNKYRLCSLITHISAMAGDQYETILVKEDKFIAIKDEQIRLVDLNYVMNSEAYILFYEFIAETKNDGLKKNLKANKKVILEGEVSFSPDQLWYLQPKYLSYLPSYWYEQYMYLSRPTMVITSHFLCPHNQLRPDYWDCFDREDKCNQSSILNQSIVSELNASIVQDQSMVLNQNQASSSLQSLELCSTVMPIAVCQFLIETFGGGPVLPCTIRPCEDCIEQAQLMRHRRRLERALIQKYDSKEDNHNHIIVEQWVRKWQQYLYAAKIQIKRNFVLGLPPPGKIPNSELLDENRKLLPNISEGQHYSLVSHKIWRILQLIYEGGPTIILKDGDLGQKKLILDYDDQETIKEIKGIIDQCKTTSLNKSSSQILDSTIIN